MVVSDDHFPELSDRAIETASNDLLESFFGRPVKPEDCPIPVELIAEQSLGYELDIVADDIYEDPDMLGGIHFDNKIIQINQSVAEHLGRYSYTIAHEIAHHVLHSKIYATNENNSDEAAIPPLTNKKPKMEVQADRFASALLLPKQLIQIAIEVAGVQRQLERYRSVYEVTSDLQGIIKAGQFTNVSKTALINRLIQLNYLPHIPYQKNLAKPNFNRDGRWRFWFYILKKRLKAIFIR